MVAVEYDGDQHRTDRRQYVKDIRRLEMLEADGLDHRPGRRRRPPADILRRVREALASGFECALTAFDCALRAEFRDLRPGRTVDSRTRTLDAAAQRQERKPRTCWWAAPGWPCPPACSGAVGWAPPGPAAQRRLHAQPQPVFGERETEDVVGAGLVVSSSQSIAPPSTRARICSTRGSVGGSASTRRAASRICSSVISARRAAGQQGHRAGQARGGEMPRGRRHFVESAYRAGSITLRRQGSGQPEGRRDHAVVGSSTPSGRTCARRLAGQFGGGGQRHLGASSPGKVSSTSVKCLMAES